MFSFYILKILLAIFKRYPLTANELPIPKKVALNNEKNKIANEDLRGNSERQAVLREKDYYITGRCMWLLKCL